MGLDSVELVLAIEEEFGIDIPDAEAERMVLVKDVYGYVKNRLHSTPPNVCLTQRIFHKLRRALIANYGFDRGRITLDMRIHDVLTNEELLEGWPFMQMFADLKMPPLKRDVWLPWLKSTSDGLTVRALIHQVLALNYHSRPLQKDSDEDIWRRLVAVIVRQIGVRAADVTPDKSFTGDFGID